MLATKQADHTLALQKATEGFTAIVDRPMDTDIIDIWKLLFSILIKKKYDDLTLMHNLSRVIIPTGRYEQIYLKGAYSILPVIALYDDTINSDATITEVYQAKVKHKARQNDRAFYGMADTACKNFIMEVVNETWYKQLEYPDTFYTNVTALKFIDHITEFWSGLHAVDVV